MFIYVIFKKTCNEAMHNMSALQLAWIKTLQIFWLILVINIYYA